MANKDYHNQIHYILENCKPTRIQIAKTLGIGRQTLSDWEYQRTKVRDYMITEVAAAAAYNVESIPAHLVERDRDNQVRKFISGKPKEDPRIPKTPTAPRKRIEKNHNGYEVELNYGKPTERNKNPWTFSDVTPQHRRIRDEGVKIPSDADYPDLISIALKGVGPYDALFVPKHSVPRCTSETGTINLPAGWYYKSASGQVHRRMTQEEAIKHIEELRQEDDLTASGLL